MGKKLFILFGIVLLAAGMRAAQVSENAARSIAAQFMSLHGMGAPAAVLPTKAPRRNLSTATTTADAAYYVFNASRGVGFVVVSGDDRTEAVLGYSDSGTFDPDDIPDGLQCFLEQYTEEIALLDAGLATAGAPQYAPSTAVEPLLTSQWGQSAPFYFQCPQLNSKYCVTGCTATSMAQIMHYHRWPTSTSRAIPAYTTKTNNISRPQLATTTFNWNAMQDYYSNGETSTTATANAAVARLMSYCGQAVEMDYGIKESSAVGYSEVYVDYFRYSTKARKVWRYDYNSSQWTNFIQTELAAKRPMIYFGRTYNGGHYFTLDGYDGNGYYHFNWGWYGNHNGYFLLTALNSDNYGTSSQPSDNGYMLNHMMIIGLEPNTVSTTERNSVSECYNLSAENTSYTRSSSDDPFVITITANHWNDCPVSRTFDLGWGVYRADGHTMIQYYSKLDNNHAFDGDGFTKLTKTLNFGKGLANGTYYLRPISRESGDATWKPCHLSGSNRIQAQINGNNLTLSVSKPGTTDGVTAYIQSYGTIKKVDRPLEVTLTATNRTVRDYIPFFLFANDKCLGGTGLYLANGSSSNLQIRYVPTASGTNTLKITSDADGNNVYCTGSVYVDASTAGDLKVTYTVPKADSNRRITGTTFQVKTEITNNSSSAYNDYVIGELYRENVNDGLYYKAGEIYRPVNISGGSLTIQYFTFTGLEPAKYMLIVRHYNYSSLVQVLKTNSYTVGALTGDINNDGAVNTGDVSALYKALLAGSTDSRYDLNGDGAVNTGDVSALYKLILSS